ncbi:MAG TPA: PKD domain-containing protein, partial [Flavisolibacter sp.]|nr:PKD domain-containing protein [Flavisolibacter sp.]
MKKLFLLICLSFSGLFAVANHITGGTIYYTYEKSGNDLIYHVILNLYRDSTSNGAQLDAQTPIAIYENVTNKMVDSRMVSKSQTVALSLKNYSPCIQSPPIIKYQVGWYPFDVTLPPSPYGYTIVYQRCCRIAGINNLIGSSNTGATYTAQIPGFNSLPDAPENNSAFFNGKDTVVVCANNSFCYDFGAVDKDGDSLAYSFCNAYIGGSTANPSPNPPEEPPYSSVNYSGFYNESMPMGPDVHLDPKTGMVCGIAPAAGIYVVTVCVTEYRRGVPIAVQRKDVQIKVGDCNVADAALKPEYISCDGFNYTFSNEAPASPLIHTYFWDFGDGGTATTSNPTHNYADTGTYTFK